MKKPETQAILLDDAYQHRAVMPGLNILLTTFDNPFSSDFFLPSGNLREWRSAYKRADVIVVSKCPEKMNENDREKFLQKINPLSRQTVFFSQYHYYRPYYMYDAGKTIELNENLHVVLVSAIASSSYLLQYLNEKVDYLDTMEYVDHHVFSAHELSQIKRHFDQIKAENKIILTTEKDATRLDLHRQYILENNLAIYVLPVDIRFHFNEQEKFNKYIQNYLLDFKV